MLIEISATPKYFNRLAEALHPSTSPFRSQCPTLSSKSQPSTRKCLSPIEPRTHKYAAVQLRVLPCSDETLYIITAATVALDRRTCSYIPAVPIVGTDIVSFAPLLPIPNGMTASPGEFRLGFGPWYGVSDVTNQCFGDCCRFVVVNLDSSWFLQARDMGMNPALNRIWGY